MKKSTSTIIAVALTTCFAGVLPGCTPAARHEQTKVESASTMKITMDKNGRAEVSWKPDAAKPTEGNAEESAAAAPAK